jgi:preprotein translocase subunit SecD
VKRNRGLWVSVIFVAVLVVASSLSLALGAFKPVLGLDLEGGLAVILSAPEGTEPGTMQQALENIRNRVDAFGVGEPDIFLSGNTIEIQIPGLSDSTVEQRDANLFCIEDTAQASYGCSADEAVATEALSGFTVGSQASQVCLLDANGDQLKCYASQDEADNAKQGITTEPKASATPSASASGTPRPSPSAGASPTVGPPQGASQYCLTDISSTELRCYPSRSAAEAAKKDITSEVTKSSWCIQAPAASTSPSATPTPSASASPSSKKSSPSASPSSSASASASASPDPTAAYAQLDTTTAEPLPCDFATKSAAQDALAGWTTAHVTTQSCVVSSQGEDLGCFTTQAAAAQRQRETGQQRLLETIGKTARLEERQTLEILPSTSPQAASLQLTCQKPEELDTPACSGKAQDQNEVWYPDDRGNYVHLGPIIITGGNITKASAQLSGGSQTDPLTQWVVAFQLDSAGADAFATATTAALQEPSPRNQIAIALDRQIISNPQVTGAITTGNGQIEGNFTEDSAKQLASLLNAGALPVELTRQSVRTVSPTLGEESLKQGIIAGIAGLILLFLYLLLYYRLLGIVAWFGMTIWAVLAIALISLAGDSFGYALTLAGVAGLVISLGVTADSYIVFFERLKDEVRSGRAPRAAVQPAFKRAFKTIVAADIVTGIAAGVLYLTAVSSVRGFALTLGVATALDLFVVYFFKRPTVYLIARTKALSEMHGFGLTAATAADHEALDTTVEPDA